MTLEEFDAWQKDAEALDIHTELTNQGPILIIERPWPQKMVLTGALLELVDLQYIEKDEGGIKIKASNGWASYEQVASAEHMLGVNIDLYGYEYRKGEWSEPTYNERENCRD